ncbi:hypothetical protein Klosneuvirus_2_28 [Klosneuvirus KNV1]|uniref:Uncharacterized protein n=1 Tax=Klosneuvirus KNV1 TaxID=1977640 RepID=A0A1V0SIP2_9VIRU|nr:hypothetical protein Klosneuvirus_2_28 [Klosneuvirus KNV1]
MQPYIDTLNDFYKTKDSFYMLCRYHRRLTIPSQKPSDLIVKLNSLNYNFTQPDFDNFLINATYQKAGSYITHEPCYDRDNWKKAIEIMFTKFTPNTKQMDHLLSCYKPANKWTEFVWVDALLAKGYNFTDSQKQHLAQCGYDMTNIYNNGTVNIEELQNIVMSVINEKTDIDKLKKIVEKNPLQYSDDFIQWIISKHILVNDHSFKQYTNILDIFFNDQYIKIHDKINSFLINNKATFNTIYYFLNKGLIPNQDLMKYCLLIPNCAVAILFMYIKHHMLIDTDIMNNLLSFSSSYYKSYIEELVYLGFDEALIEKCENKWGYQSYTYNMIPFIIHYHIKPDEKTFELACEKHNVELFDHCISHNLIPTKKHLIIALNNTNYSNKYTEFINKLLCYKIIPDSDCVNFLNNLPIINNPNYYNLYCKPIIELFIKFGYKPSFNDIKLFLENNINLDNLEHLGIKYDDNLYYISHITNNWYYDSKFKLNNEKILGLRQLCRKGSSVDQIKTYMSENNVQLDYYCLEHALITDITLAEWIIEEYKCNIPITTHYLIGKFDVYKDKAKKMYYMLLERNKIDDAYLGTSIKK